MSEALTEEEKEELKRCFNYIRLCLKRDSIVRLGAKMRVMDAAREFLSAQIYTDFDKREAILADHVIMSLFKIDNEGKETK